MKLDKQLFIAEQVVEDPVMGIRVEFRVVPASSEPYRISLRAANGKIRELRFDEKGLVAGIGTHFDEPTPQRRLTVVKT